MKRSTIRNLTFFSVMAFLTMGTSGCLFFGGKPKSPLAGTKASPDKVLYNEAANDIQHGRYTVARLDLEALINTYPNSEYLAKAKLAIANSYYKQGGTEGLTQAVAEYKDFITFFPFLHEAAFAQYRAAMAHFRMMGKADRDPTQAMEAEAELQTMILKYPHSQWTAEARQRLRDVQEVLAQSDYDIAQFYEVRGAYGAAAARLLELTKRYPLFSEADEANWLLGQIYQKTEHKNFAARFYQNIVREYPLSPLVPKAKQELVALGYPVPQPDPKALARMQKQQEYLRKHHGPGVWKDALSVLKSSPNYSAASHYGPPDLTPESNIISARQVLQPSVVNKAVDSAAVDMGSKITVAAISADTTEGTSIPSASSKRLGAKEDAASAVVASSASVGQDQAQNMKDPTKGPKSSKHKALKKNGKQANQLPNGKKKKGLLHKLIPW